MTLKRAVSIEQLIKMKFPKLEFTGDFRASFGAPPSAGCWFVQGPSFHGKTSFVIKLIKYLTRFERAGYDTLEEGVSSSFQDAAIEHDLASVAGKLTFIHKEQVAELDERLAKHKSPKIIVVDSIQYLKCRKWQLIDLMDKYPNHLFIFVSHEDERSYPVGTLAKAIHYHATVKIRVEGYKAFIKRRGFDGPPFVIWKEKADKYWLDGNK